MDAPTLLPRRPSIIWVDLQDHVDLCAIRRLRADYFWTPDIGEDLTNSAVATQLTRLSADNNYALNRQFAHAQRYERVVDHDAAYYCTVANKNAVEVAVVFNRFVFGTFDMTPNEPSQAELTSLFGKPRAATEAAQGVPTAEAEVVLPPSTTIEDWYRKVVTTAAAPAAPAVSLGGRPWQPRNMRPWDRDDYVHPKTLVGLSMPAHANPWAEVSYETYMSLRRDGKKLDRKWRRAISFAINKAMRHNKSLPIHPAGFCFLEDLAWVLPGGGHLHRTPTQLEIMQVISAEDVGRFEGTCIEGQWPPRERDVLARCVQGHSRSPAQGLSDDAIHSKYTAATAKTGPLLFHYTCDKLLFPILASGCIIPGGAHTNEPMCSCLATACPTLASSPTNSRSE